ncbi:hypothetical protein [Campylobacter corcagiensis]|uniref:Uncharacterized protein n=1 Tax=Campylobacter corcagiensis TaxID=1448857 RepID=A0A7M1LI77_9BACT|nr:hypothetical protein [Campylobacter corcagiensis]QKF64231.1 hypothetical protein CCORG_0345 [Campylobacter corcagiensis]QOQ87576.1 hypothetical protein IMC76_01840 [Campylobacter corcagiensis]
MKKVSIILLLAIVLNAQDYSLDVGKALSDGMKQGIKGLGKAIMDKTERNKDTDQIKDNFQEKYNKFDNLKIEGEWTLKMDKVVTSFLNSAGNKWDIKLKDDNSVYLGNRLDNRKWSFKNDILEFKTEGFQPFNFKEKIKFIKYVGNFCYKVLYNDNKASMCKTKGKILKDGSKAIKIEIH